MYLVCWMLLVFLVGTFVGHVLHWVMHRRWSGPLFRSHLTHHVLYTSSKYHSDKYRNPGKDNSALYFVPIITIIICALLWLAPSEFVVWLFLEGIIIGTAHELIHRSFHLKNSKLRKFKWFRNIEALHKEHHRKVHYNYGIFWLGWDRIFGSYHRPKSDNA